MGGRDGQFFLNLFLLFRAVVGSIARRVLVVKSSRSLCTVRRLFPTPGDTLPASPLLGSKITPVTFRRRINSYIVWDQWGLSATAWDHTHTCRRFCYCLNAVAHFLYLNILPAGCLSSLLYPNFYLDLWWARLRLFRGNAYKVVR